MIPQLTRLLFSSIRTGASWVTEAFISYCEMVVRWTVRAVIAVIIAGGLVQLSIRFDSNLLLLLGVVLGGIVLLIFAVVTSPIRLLAGALSDFSESAQGEVERLSNIFFLFVVTIFYLGIDHGQRHPDLLKVFLGLMLVLFVGAITMSRGRTMSFFRSRFQFLVLIPVAAMTILTVVPEAITDRVSNGYLMEKASGTVTGEISFRIDEQDQIIDLSTNQPMEIFKRVHKEGEEPEPIKGWTKDKKGNYHIWTWFNKQGNSTPAGQKITPFTLAKVEDIIIETKRLNENKIAEAQKLADDQKAKFDEESARLKAEEEQKQEAQRTIDELARQQAEIERIAREAVEEGQRQLALRPIEVASRIMATTDQTDGMMVVQPTSSFMFRGQEISPENSAIIINVVEVKETSDKNKYLLLLQPEMIVSNGVKYDISRSTGSFDLTVKKDNSRNLLKIIGGAAAGVVIGGLLDGKEGAIKGGIAGVAIGTVYSMSRHGKKFQLTVGDPVPLIRIRP